MQLVDSPHKKWKSMTSSITQDHTMNVKCSIEDTWDRPKKKFLVRKYIVTTLGQQDNQAHFAKKIWASYLESFG